MIVKKQIGKLPTLLGAYDSTKTYSKKNRVTLYGSEFESLIDDNTYAPATLDSEGKTVTFDEEHWLVVSNGTGAFLAGEKLDQFSFEDNPEFVSAETDNEGKLLESTDIEGKKIFYGDVEVKGTFTNESYAEGVKKVITDAIDTKVDKEDGKTLIDEDVADNFSEEDNPEYVAVKTDAEDKIIDSTDTEGIVTHNTKHIFNGGIEDTEGGLKKEALQYAIDNSSDLAKALKEGGYLFSATDWSDYISNDGDNPLHLPEPRCAIINLITADDIDLTQLDKAAYLDSSYEGTRYNVPVEVQYWDKLGNYFKKKALISGQGNSSRSFVKKNIAIDFFDSEYDGDAFAIKFGKWVAQDSFHLKAYYTDFLKGVSVIGYKFADMVENYGRSKYANKPWKKALVNSSAIDIDAPNPVLSDEFDENIDTGALCHPDGFPVIIFQNGEFYGIFAYCLKKHRDNYHMDKDTPEHIHLDGDLYDSTITGGTIDWTKFEIRNPKNLYYKEAQTDKDGNETYEYDADIAQAEIAGDDEVNAWTTTGLLPDGTKITSKIKKRLQTTAKVKNYIIAFSKIKSEIFAATTDDEKKALYEKYFDVDNLVDYLIVQHVLWDTDSMGKNWQWITYDGVKWYVTEYDKDLSMGNTSGGTSIRDIYFPNWAPMGGTGSLMTPFWTLYTDNINSRAKELIDAGILSSDTLIQLISDWTDRIGWDWYQKEYEQKWTESPCYRDDGVDHDHWEREGYVLSTVYSSSTTYAKDRVVLSGGKVYKSLVDSNTADVTDTASWEDVSYDDTKTYVEGDTCYMFLDVSVWYQKFKAKAETTGNNPIIKRYNYNPKVLGYKDSVWRFIKFAEEHTATIKEYVAKQTA